MLTHEQIVKFGWLNNMPMKPSTMKNVTKLKNCLQSNEYIIEPKIDGHHVWLIGGRLYTSHGRDVTNNVPELIKYFNNIPEIEKIVIDGECYYPGKTSEEVNSVLNTLPVNAIKVQKSWGPIHFVVWDILSTPQTKFLFNVQLMERKKILKAFLNYAQEVNTRLHNKYPIYEQPIIEENKEQWVNSYMDSGYEGGVLKRKNGVYHLNKKPMGEWIKIKTSKEIDGFITGYELPEKAYTGKNVENWLFWEDGHPVTKNYAQGLIGSIEISRLDVNGIQYKLCTVSGISDTLRIEISKNKDTFLKRVVKVNYMEKTKKGLRHPKFKSFHENKNWQECVDIEG